MPIRQLPPLLVNQIAAGEVIERPASVVKECVENAIDAGACRIDVAIEAGGKELIRIADDGCGIPFDELELAVAPHATSKIEKQEDLDAIATMGFRGEAIASIASVSRLSILSRPKDQNEAGLIESEGEHTKPPRPASGPPGTTITVRNLFFNTPARRKFLKTDQTEAGRISDALENLALAHPAIAFSLQQNQRKTIDLPPESTPFERAFDVLGRELQPQLLPIDVDERGMRLRGLAGTPDIARGTSKHQRIFLNGRLINDRSIVHAIKEAYRGLIEPCRFPTIVLFIEMNPAQVDVNVHPAKLEVRFRNQAQVHGTVLSTIRRVLRDADLTPSFDLHRTDEGRARLAVPPMPPPEFGRGRSRTPGTHDDSGTASTSTSDEHDSAAQVAAYLKQLNPKQKGFIYSEVKQALALEAPELLGDVRDEGSSRNPSAPQSPDLSHDQLPTLRAATDVMQVHSSFLVTQDENGLLIIDQHALHERVMFEKLRERMEAGTLESQRLLMPATVIVDRSQVDHLDSLKPLLNRLGIDVEPIGPTTIAVHSFTGLLFERNVDPVDFMTDLLNRAENDGLADDPEAALHEVLDMMACKAAIKAGDRLSQSELAELLRYRDQVERSSNCPHGRPTSLRLTIHDLEKQFGRT